MWNVLIKRYTKTLNKNYVQKSYVNESQTFMKHLINMFKSGFSPSNVLTISFKEI